MSQVVREKKINSRVVYRGKIVDVFVDQVRVPNGQTHIREVVGHRPAVAIVPVLPDNRVLMIRQYRYAVKKTLWELPAGLIDPGETSLQAARRELLEETGYGAKKMMPMGAVYSSPGFNREKIYLFLATGLEKKSRPSLDEGENLSTAIMTVKKIRTMIREGELEDGKSVLGLILAFEKWPKL